MARASADAAPVPRPPGISAACTVCSPDLGSLGGDPVSRVHFAAQPSYTFLLSYRRGAIVHRSTGPIDMG